MWMMKIFMEYGKSVPKEKAEDFHIHEEELTLCPLHIFERKVD